MSSFTYEFTGQIVWHGVGRSRVVTYKVVFLPRRFEKKLPFKTYPRLRVAGEIADVPVRGAWMPVGDGRRYFIVSPRVVTESGLDVGDQVAMRFCVDDQDFVDVPKALEGALKADAVALERWEGLSAGKKRMFTNHVSSAKTPPTEKRRIDEALDAIAQGITLRERQRRWALCSFASKK